MSARTDMCLDKLLEELDQKWRAYRNTEKYLLENATNLFAETENFIQGTSEGISKLLGIDDCIFLKEKRVDVKNKQVFVTYSLKSPHRSNEGHLFFEIGISKIKFSGYDGPRELDTRNPNTTFFEAITELVIKHFEP